MTLEAAGAVERPRVRQGRGGPWSWLVSLFLTAWGAKLWLIGRFGTPLPFWDQWEEAPVVYMPYFEGHLSLTALLSPHNETRPFFTRVFGLALLLLNGQWDAQVQMVLNAAMHALTITGFGWVVARRVGERCWPLLWLPLAAVIVLPFGWESTLAGFHSVFFFMLLFSLPAMVLLGLKPVWSAGWWLGVLLAFCALFNVASGFIAASAVLAMLGLKIFKQPGTWRRHLPTLAACAVITLTGLLIKVDVPQHAILMAHSVSDFLTAFGKNLAWPWIVLPPLAVINFLPLTLLLWFYLRSPEEPRPAEELTLTIGFWTILSGLATAYARGAGGAHPQWRYMDASSFALAGNAIAILVLLTRYRGRTWLGRREPAAYLAWALMNAAGLLLLCDRAWRLDIPERDFYAHAWVRNVRAFMATEDMKYLSAKQKEQRALFYPDRLAWILRDPNIRPRLPVSVREPLSVVPATPTSGAFVPRGWSLRKPDPPTEVSWGSYNASGAAATGRFESEPVRASRLPYLQLDVTGDLGQPGLSLELVEVATQKRTPVVPRGRADGWQSCVVKAPSGPFRIVANDSSTTGWFAFKEPRELGRLSWWAIECLRFGRALFFLGLGLYLVTLLRRISLWLKR